MTFTYIDFEHVQPERIDYEYVWLIHVANTKVRFVALVAHIKHLEAKKSRFRYLDATYNSHQCLNCWN